MIINCFKKVILATLLVGFSLIASPVFAQDDFGKVQQEGIDSMKAGDWKGAQKIFQEFIDDFSATAPKLYGPKFGWFYYNKGFAELKLKDYDSAAESFSTCFEKYPNNLEGAAKTKNNYHSRSLLKWGEAEQGRGNFKKATELYEKFNDVRVKSEKFDKGSFYVNLGISYLSLDKANIKKGLESLESALVNRTNWNVSAGNTMFGLRALVEVAIKNKDDQVVVDFVKKHRSKLMYSDREMIAYGPLIASLASKAANAKMDNTSFVLLSIAPSTQRAIAETDELLKAMGPAEKFVDKLKRRVIDKQRLEKSLSSLEKQQALGKSFDSNIYKISAILYERAGNSLAAHSAYEVLHNQYPKAKGAEANLYHLIRTASGLGRVTQAEAYGAQYEKRFPKGSNMDKVRGITLRSLLGKGEYGKAIRIGEKTLAKIDEKTEEHNEVLAVVATAQFYDGKLKKAVQSIKQHLSLYPESDRKNALTYFLGSALNRLGRKAEASTNLKAFLKANPDPQSNTFYVQANNELASIDYALAKYDESMAIIAQLEKSHANDPNIAGSLNVKGNIQQIKKDFVGAKASYERALELAAKGGDSIFAGEAIGALIALHDGGKLELAEEKSQKEIVRLYDEFFAKHSKNSPYGGRIAVTAFPAMMKSGRTEDALSRLQKIIVDLSKQPLQLGMEEAINAYTDAYLQTKSADQLKEHYYNFPGIGVKDYASQALLRIAVVGVYERLSQQAKKENNKDAQIKADASIKISFQELKSDFKVKDLSNVILVKLGDYIRNNSTAKTEAVAYYEAALNRQDKTKKYEAHFGLGDILLNSSDAGSVKKGINNLLTAYKESSVQDQAPLKEAALYRIIQHFVTVGDWQKVNEYAKTYRESKKPRFTKHSGEVLFAYAQSFDKLGKENDAVAQYTVLIGPFAGRIDLAAPAYKRYLEILWKRNKPGKVGENLDPNHPSNFGSRQAATYAIEVWLEATGNQKEKFSSEDLKLWEDLKKTVEEYIGKDPNIRSLAAIREARGPQ